MININSTEAEIELEIAKERLHQAEVSAGMLPVITKATEYMQWFVEEDMNTHGVESTAQLLDTVFAHWGDNRVTWYEVQHLANSIDESIELLDIPRKHKKNMETKKVAMMTVRNVFITELMYQYMKMREEREQKA